MKPDLDGVEALVTGAGRGLGRGIAMSLAAAGARVWANDLPSDELERTAATIQERGASIRAVPFDLRDAAACNDAVAALLDEVTTIDVLVNNAALLIESPVAETDPGDWQATLEVNLTAPFRLIRQVLPAMCRAGGSVINISSRAGVEPFAGEAAYCASKYGIEALTRCLACELAGVPVSANTVTPGARIKPTGLSEAGAAEAPEATRREWSDPAALAPAFVLLARLEGEVSGCRFDAERLTAAILRDGASAVAGQLEELAE